MRFPTQCVLTAILFGLADATSGLWHAHASKLLTSRNESTIPQNCDLCWSPAATESPLPSTLQPHRQRHPRDSRPHRLPKGRYKIGPYQKQARPPVLGRLYGRRLPASQPIYTIDGDTLLVGTDRIRLRGIDAPELTELSGHAARQRLEQLLQEGPIRIVPYGQDVYGRTIADVLVDGRNVAEVLRQEGYAKPR